MLPATGYRHVLSEAACCHLKLLRCVVTPLHARFFFFSFSNSFVSSKSYTYVRACTCISFRISVYKMDFIWYASRVLHRMTKCVMLWNAPNWYSFRARLLVHNLIHLFIYSETIGPEIFSVSRSTSVLWYSIYETKLIVRFTECTIGSYLVFVPTITFSTYKLYCKSAGEQRSMGRNIRRKRKKKLDK